MINSEHAISMEVSDSYYSSWRLPKTATASISTLAFLKKENWNKK
jgi:hypothetical protein